MRATAVVVKVAETVVAGKMAEIAVETTMEVMAVAEMAVEVMAVEVMAVEVMAVGLSSPRWRIGLIQRRRRACVRVRRGRFKPEGRTADASPPRSI